MLNIVYNLFCLPDEMLMKETAEDTQLSAGIGGHYMYHSWRCQLHQQAKQFITEKWSQVKHPLPFFPLSWSQASCPPPPHPS